MKPDWKPPTYEQYKRATEFARTRYKYGHIITLIACISLIALLIGVVIYSEQLKANPIHYAMNRLDLKECTCRSLDLSDDLYINSTSIEIIPKLFEE